MTDSDDDTSTIEAVPVACGGEDSTNSPADVTAYVLVEEIEYEVTVTNDGTDATEHRCERTF